jgi:hypothetical protein
MASLAALPRLLSAPLDDIKTIARGIQLLPDLLKNLEAIRVSAASMDDEVKKMRKAVEAMQVGVDDLPEHLDRIQDSVPFSRKRKK